ncbi:MAG: ABC transporter permease [Dehalococcoidia bacterium]|nr:ABC transporter permease [Dehalococcoidia bacterium]
MTASYILLVMFALTPWLNLVQSPLVLLVIPLAVIPGLLFSCISICFASIARAMSQFSYFFNLIVNPMFWFGGAFFPYRELPEWAQIAGWFIPLSHVVSLYRGLLEGALEWSHLGDIAWLLVVTAFFYWLAIVSMRRRLVH